MKVIQRVHPTLWHHRPVYWLRVPRYSRVQTNLFYSGRPFELRESAPLAEEPRGFFLFRHLRHQSHESQHGYDLRP